MYTDHAKAAWVALSLALGPRSARLKPLLKAFGSPAAILAAAPEDIRAVLPDIGKGALAALQGTKQEKETARILAYCRREGVEILTPDAPEYPAGLFAIGEPPAVLYCRGKLPVAGTRPFVGMVGTRTLDAYGERMAYKLSFELAASGAVVVSGLADGIDGIAAAAALDAGMPTVGVLGCGIDRVYPKHHARLYAEVAEQGAVVSEFAPGTPPYGWNFPMRNRIISALSEAVVVVEADEESGALITARYALVQGKSLFAVPGDADQVRSVGCNMLLRGGAMMALCGEDILSHFRFLYRDSMDMRVPDEVLQYTGVTPEKLHRHGLQEVNAEAEPKARAKKEPREKAKKRETELPVAEISPAVLDSLSQGERAIYDKLPSTPFTIDLLVGEGIGAKEAVAAMTLFEILGLIASRPGGTYLKK
ncbi:MAG: DNA-processing protein DprA [Clostridia bacterium]|nr:DNA-processing protein DprA [Clostridia bacterium]